MVSDDIHLAHTLPHLKFRLVQFLMIHESKLEKIIVHVCSEARPRDIFGQDEHFQHFTSLCASSIGSVRK